MKFLFTSGYMKPCAKDVTIEEVNKEIICQNIYFFKFYLYEFMIFRTIHFDIIN